MSQITPRLCLLAFRYFPLITYNLCLHCLVPPHLQFLLCTKHDGVWTICSSKQGDRLFLLNVTLVFFALTHHLLWDANSFSTHFTSSAILEESANFLSSLKIQLFCGFLLVDNEQKKTASHYRKCLSEGCLHRSFQMGILICIDCY